MSRRAISCTYREGRCSRSRSISTDSKRRGALCPSSKACAVGRDGPALPAWRTSRFRTPVRSSTCPARRGLSRAIWCCSIGKGVTAALKLPPGRYEFPRVSPDGSRIAFETTDRQRNRHLNLRDCPARATYGGSPTAETTASHSGPPTAAAWRFNPIATAIRRCSGNQLRVATRCASRSPNAERRMCRSRGLPTARCFCSARRRTRITHSGRSPCGMEKRRCSRETRLEAACERVVLSRRPLGGVSDRTSRDASRYDLRAALPADGDQAPDRTGRPPAVVPRRQGALLHPGAWAVSSSNGEHTTELYVHQARRPAARVRDCQSRFSPACTTCCRTAGSSASASRTQAPADHRFTSS